MNNVVMWFKLFSCSFMVAGLHSNSQYLSPSQIDLVKQKSSMLQTVRLLTDGFLDGKSLADSHAGKMKKKKKKKVEKKSLFDAADKALGFNSMNENSLEDDNALEASESMFVII